MKSQFQTASETSQELALNVKRLFIFEYPECTANVKEDLILHYFIPAVQDLEIHQALRL